MKRNMKTESKEELLKFIEAIVYILTIVIVVFSNVYGNVYFKFIPLLFILGIVGNIVFKRPIITTIFGMIVCICTIYLNGTRNILDNLFNSLLLSVNIALGEIFISSLLKCIKYVKCLKRNKEKICLNIKESIKYLSIPFLTLTFFLISYNYINSNIFELCSAKSRLNDYLNTNNKIDYTISNINFSIVPNRGFRFRLYDNDTLRNYEYIVYTNKSMEIKDVQNYNINEKIKAYNLKLNELISKLKVTDIDVRVIYENMEYVIEFTKNVNNISDNTIKDYSMQISNIIDNDEFDKILRQVSRVLIILEDKEDTSKNIVSYFYVDNYYKNKNTNITKTYSYINDSLTVEYID